MIDFSEFIEYIKMDGKLRADLTQEDLALLTKILKEEVLCVIV